MTDNIVGAHRAHQRRRLGLAPTPTGCGHRASAHATASSCSRSAAASEERNISPNLVRAMRARAGSGRERRRRRRSRRRQLRATADRLRADPRPSRPPTSPRRPRACRRSCGTSWCRTPAWPRPPRSGSRSPSRCSTSYVIITRTPLRISLGGGGTDLPHYSDQSGGFLVAAAISKYVFIAVNPTFDDELLLKYRSVESVDRSRRHHSTRCCARCLVHLGDRPRRRDLVDGRHPCGHRARLVGQLRRGRRCTRCTRTSTRSCRTCVLAEEACHDRDRSARRAHRQAGPVHRGARRRSPRSSSTTTAPSSVRRYSSPRGPPPARGQPAALLHRRAPLRVRRPRGRSASTGASGAGTSTRTSTR